MEIPFDNKLIHVYKHLSRLDETYISEIYDNIVKIVPIEPKLNKQQNNIKRVKKTIIVKPSNDSTDNKPKTTQNNKVIVSKTRKSIKDDYDEENDNIDTNEEDPLQKKKIELILKYVNGLLKNMGKEEIHNLIEFVRIDRIDILTEANTNYLESIAKELFPTFDRKECKYFPKSSKGRLVLVLKNMLKNTNEYELDSLNKEIYEGKYRRRATFYTIKKTI